MLTGGKNAIRKTGSRDPIPEKYFDFLIEYIEINEKLLKKHKII